MCAERKTYKARKQPYARPPVDLERLLNEIERRAAIESSGRGRGRGRGTTMPPSPAAAASPRFTHPFQRSLPSPRQPKTGQVRTQRTTLQSGEVIERKVFIPDKQKSQKERIESRLRELKKIQSLGT
jgi:hypothetical protein